MSLSARLIPVLLAAVCLAGLAGCAGQQKWCHKVATAEEAKQYEDRCLEDALVTVRNRTRAEEHTTVHREFEKCMRGYGFFHCR